MLFALQRLSGGPVQFNEAVRQGHPFIWTGGMSQWPVDGLGGFSCQSFSDHFPEAVARAELAAGGALEVMGQANWDIPRLQNFSGKSQSVPSVWHVKDEATDEQKSKFLSIFPGIPQILSPLQNAHLRDSAEVWLQPEGAGALAHVDGYCTGVLSFQIRGRKLWRLMNPPGFERLADGFFDDTDGGIYRSNSSTIFLPEMEAWVEEGEILFFPPGIIHETLSPIGGGCTVSVTALMRAPLPTGYIREFLPGISLLGDRVRCMHEWSPLVLLSMVPHKLASNRSFALAESMFTQVDTNLDRVISRSEISVFLKGHIGQDLVNSSELNYLGFTRAKLPIQISQETVEWFAIDALGFWDENGDGCASFGEVLNFIKIFLRNHLRSRMVSSALRNGQSIEAVEAGWAVFKDFLF